MRRIIRAGFLAHDQIGHNEISLGSWSYPLHAFYVPAPPEPKAAAPSTTDRVLNDVVAEKSPFTPDSFKCGIDANCGSSLSLTAPPNQATEPREDVTKSKVGDVTATEPETEPSGIIEPWLLQWLIVGWTLDLIPGFVFWKRGASFLRGWLIGVILSPILAIPVVLTQITEAELSKMTEAEVLRASKRKGPRRKVHSIFPASGRASQPATTTQTNNFPEAAAALPCWSCRAEIGFWRPFLSKLWGQGWRRSNYTDQPGRASRTSHSIDRGTINWRTR